MSKKIYLDYAAATPLDPRVERVMARAEKIFGNASSVHWAGREAQKIIDQSRAKIGRILHCRPGEIVFTGSGTESANLAIFGMALAYRKLDEHKNPGGHTRLNFRTSASGAVATGKSENLGGHIITTKIEHHAVLRACQYLEKFEGFKVTYLDVKPDGIIDPEAIRKALRPDTILVSVMYANNEIGTIQPIKQIAKIIKSSKLKAISYKLKPIFHSDACQAAGALDINVQNLGVDLLTLNGSKIYGPKGTGCLFVKRGLRPLPIIVGGGQERGLRAGTENPALIAGFAAALEIADKNKIRESARLTKLRDFAITKILRSVLKARLNGDPVKRLPNNINISFKGIDGEMLMLALDQKGIAVSTGSACTTTETGPSHVLKAIKNPQGWGNVRITLGKQTTQSELNYLLANLPREVKKLQYQNRP